MRQIIARLKTWNPSRRLTAAVVIAGSMLTVASLTLAYVVSYDSEQVTPSGNTLSGSATNDSDVELIPAVGVVSHVTPNDVRLYVERGPGESPAGAYACLYDQTELASSGPLEAPFTLIDELESGREISCTVTLGLGQDKVDVPAFRTPLPLERMQEEIEFAISVKTAVDTTLRMSWDPLPLESYENAWLDYVVTSDDALVAAGRKDMNSKGLIHDLSLDEENLPSNLIVSAWLVGQHTGFRILGDVAKIERSDNGDWISTGVLATADEVDSYYPRVFADEIVETSLEGSSPVTNGGKLLTFTSPSTGWMLLSENGSSMGEWQTLRIPQGSKEIERAALGGLAFAMHARIDDFSISHGLARRFDGSTASWNVVNPTLTFRDLSTGYLSWNMWNVAFAGEEWVDSDTGTFIVRARDAFTGKETIGITGRADGVELPGLIPGNLYEFSVEYVDMRPLGTTVVPARFNMRASVQEKIVTQVPFTARIDSGQLQLSWSDVSADYPLVYWVQVLDQDREPYLSKRVSEAVGERFVETLDVSNAPGNIVFVRVTAVDYSGRASSTPFTELRVSSNESSDVGPIENLKASQLGAREVKLTWRSSPAVQEGGGVYEVQEYQDGEWIVSSTALRDSEFDLVVDDELGSFVVRIRARTETSVGEYSVIRCSINNGLFCE